MPAWWMLTVHAGQPPAPNRHAKKQRHRSTCNMRMHVRSSSRSSQMQHRITMPQALPAPMCIPHVPDAKCSRNLLPVATKRATAARKGCGKTTQPEFSCSKHSKCISTRNTRTGYVNPLHPLLPSATHIHPLVQHRCKAVNNIHKADEQAHLARWKSCLQPVALTTIPHRHKPACSAMNV